MYSNSKESKTTVTPIYCPFHSTANLKKLFSTLWKVPQWHFWESEGQSDLESSYPSFERLQYPLQFWLKEFSTIIIQMSSLLKNVKNIEIITLHRCPTYIRVFILISFFSLFTPQHLLKENTFIAISLFLKSLKANYQNPWAFIIYNINLCHAVSLMMYP